MTLTVLGLLGAVISGYVWYKQTTPGPVLCLGQGCAKVIRSPYGRLLGIPNGALGVAYFGATALTPVAGTRVPEVWVLLGAASAVALLLYAYLTYLQFAVLRAWCVWCLTSAALALAIFFGVLAR
ncbi:MAG TPA: vitamin K epoxide reductase family protein [bacterium]|nr:vitamin K epoxide reductase family protein [bacterium]